jgi:UrcA family protein
LNGATQQTQHPPRAAAQLSQSAAGARCLSLHINFNKGEFLKTIVTAIALLIASAANAGNPNTANEPISKETVRFSELNLSTRSGVEALYKRITAAAGHVCGKMYDGSERNLKILSDIKHCKADAIRGAVTGSRNAALNNYWLSQINENRTELASVKR